jgi:hypothetical protein
MKNVQIPTDLPYLFIAAIPIFSSSFLVDLRDPQLLLAMRSFNLSDDGDNGSCQYSFDGLERRGDKLDGITQLRPNGLVRHSQEIPLHVVSGTRGAFPDAVDVILRGFIQKLDNLYKFASVNEPIMLAMRIKSESTVTGIYPAEGMPGAIVFREGSLLGASMFFLSCRLMT